MNSKRLGGWVGTIALTLTFLAGAANAFAQVTGTITGSVGDNVGVVPGVTVTATETTLGVNRNTTTNENGLFRLLSLPPGTYTIKVEMDGFKPVTMNDIRLSSAEIRDLGKLTLAAGGVSESVTITAEVTPVQTATSSRAQTLTGDTLTTIQVKGRDLFGLLRTLPGVMDPNQNRDFTSWTSANNVSINGATTQSKSVVVDGFAANDEGGCGTAYVNPNIDAVGEVQVIANGFTAENGRNTGGLIQITTKSGTNQLKGSAWYNGRRDQFNSNDFFRKKNGNPKPFYAVNISGYSVGGPVVIPGAIDSRSSTRKLYFFASQEFTDDKRPSTQTRTNLPTALERTGNFSDTRLSTTSDNGKVQPIIDPNTGIAFPGNIIPANRINPLGQAMLNLLPLPNGILTTVAADVWKSNDLQDTTPLHDRKNFVARVDAVITQNMRGSVKWLQDSDNSITFNALAPGLGQINNYVPGKVVTGALSQVLGAAMVNEINVGFGYNRWGHKIERGGGLDFANYTSRYQQNIGIFPARIEPFGAYGDPQLSLNQRDEYPYLPDMLYSGGDRAGLASYRPTGGNGPLPKLNISERISAQDDLSITKGRHNLKFGIYTEYSIKTEPGSSGYAGVYNFGHDATNPLSTGNGYANALLGNFTSYSELSNRVDASRRHWQTDGYAQDSWRVNSRLTLDYGLRFTHSGSIYEVRHQNSAFDPTQWSAANAPLLYLPVCSTGVPGNQTCSSANRRAIDPRNPGVLLPQYLTGNLVPGTGSINNGIIYDGLPGKKQGWYFDLPYLVAAPRVGMAWDINGDGKSALRASTGIFYNFPRASDTYRFTRGPDISLNRTINNSNFDDILAAAAAGTGFNSQPATSNLANPGIKLETSYQANVAYQRDIGFSTVAEVAYVGNFGRNGQRRQTINNVPLYAFGGPKYQFNVDAVNANFARQPYPGVGNIEKYATNEVSLNYNAMQVSVQRRLSHGLQMGVAYTLSKGEGRTGWDYYTENYLGGQEALDARYYGPTGNDRRHNLVINYSYNIPTATQLPVLKQIVTDWQVSGLTQFLSGVARTPTCGLSGTQAGVYNQDPSLTGVDMRCQLTGQDVNSFVADASLPVEEQLHFNPAAFTRVRIANGATVGNFGDQPVGQVRNPGWWNQDFTLARRIPVQIGRGGSARIQFQIYNLFNMTQFTTVAIAQSFNASNVNQTSNIGQYTETTNPRQMGLTIRFDY